MPTAILNNDFQPSSGACGDEIVDSKKVPGEIERATMEQISLTCELKTCSCGQPHRIARRTFMRSLLAGAIAFPFLPVTQPAIAAARQPKALVLSALISAL
ncbi:MAG: hypothetical protein MUD14_04090 [Hydrococcus sp. Prado102]|nr:hypothetical protein [Hydrococcus sp. Prado102]